MGALPRCLPSRRELLMWRSGLARQTYSETRVRFPNGTRSNLHNSSTRFHCTLIIGSLDSSGRLKDPAPILGLDWLQGPAITDVKHPRIRGGLDLAFVAAPEPVFTLSHAHPVDIAGSPTLNQRLDRRGSNSVAASNQRIDPDQPIGSSM